MRAIVLALGVLAAPVAAAEQQFDLICKAKKTEMRFRVDLAAGEYCTDECKSIEKIASVTSGVITFSETEPALPRAIRAYNRVNRTTGDWEWFYDERAFAVAQDIRGRCERGAFSGFPAAKF